jgi:hypothetical protein
MSMTDQTTTQNIPGIDKKVTLALARVCGTTQNVKEDSHPIFLLLGTATRNEHQSMQIIRRQYHND